MRCAFRLEATRVASQSARSASGYRADVTAIFSSAGGRWLLAGAVRALTFGGIPPPNLFILRWTTNFVAPEYLIG